MEQQPSITYEVLEPLYPSVGSLVTNWAILEQSLEFWVAMIFHSWKAGTKLKERRIPHQFSAKVRFLRRAFTELSALEKYEAEGLDLLDRNRGNG